jgi:hypothetical protein
MATVFQTGDELPVADKDDILRDPNNGTDRKIFAGQPVPADLVDVYNEKHGSKRTAAKKDDA